MGEITEEGFDLLATILILTIVASIGFHFQLSVYNQAKQDRYGGIEDKTARVSQGYVDEDYVESLDYKDVLLMVNLQDETLPQHKSFGIGSEYYTVDYDYKFNREAYWRSALAQMRSMGDHTTASYRFVYNTTSDMYILVKE